jgi:hypothetical protein
VTRRVRLDRVRIDQELSFREAALVLGRKHDPRGERLRNLVTNREKQTGKQIAIRLAGETEPKLRITLSALYRAFPECRPVRVESLASSLRELLDRVDQHTEGVVLKILEEKQLEKRLAKLEKRADAAEAFLRTIAENDVELGRTTRKRPTG